MMKTLKIDVGNSFHERFLVKCCMAVLGSDFYAPVCCIAITLQMTVGEMQSQPLHWCKAEKQL